MVIVKGFKIVSMLLLGTGFTLSGAYLAWHEERTPHALLSSPGILQQLEELHDNQAIARIKTVSPLVQQAQVFGNYLDPPPPVKPVQQKRVVKNTQPLTNPQRKTNITISPPSVTTPKFHILAISRYPAKPEKSFALIKEPGTESRWVRVGDRVGHLLIEEINKGQIVWRNGMKTGQLAVLDKQKQQTPDPAIATRVIAKPMHKPTVLLQENSRNTTLPPSKPIPIVRGLKQRR